MAEQFDDKVEPIDPHHMVRTDDPETSHEAAHSVDHTTRAEQVLALIRAHGQLGCISDDLQAMFGIEDQRDKAVSYSGVTGYFAKLERAFFIERTGETRHGHRFKRRQLVMRALSNEERAQRMAELDAALAVSMLPSSLELLTEWWKADLALRAAQECEAALRAQVVDLLIPYKVVGKYRAELPHNNELRIQILKDDTRLSVRELSAKEVAGRNADDVVPVTDTDDVRWDDEYG